MCAVTIASGKFTEAIDHLTEAIMLNPKSAILYADRGESQTCDYSCCDAPYD